MTIPATVAARSLACLLCMSGGLAAGAADEARQPARDAPAKKDEKRLPKLPEKDLPPQTRQKPDPVRTQFLKEPVHVKVEETIRHDDGSTVQQTTNVLASYLQEYLRRAGHPIAASADAAVYRLEGTLEAQLHSTLKVQGKVVTWKLRGSSLLRLLSRDGSELERFEVPELFEDNVRSEESAALQIRRRIAKLQWDKIYQDGKSLGHPEIVALIGSLVSDPSAGEDLTAESVVERLADAGLQAVRYLREAMTDRRIVRVPSAYPGLKGRNLDDLRVYHLADKALEEIFQKVSRMSITVGPEDTDSARLRRVITLGWENEWRRFCRPYAESPQAPSKRPGPAGATATGQPKDGDAARK